MKSLILLACAILICPLVNAQINKNSDSHAQVDQSNESEAIGKESSRLQTVEGKVKQPTPKVIQNCQWSFALGFVLNFCRSVYSCQNCNFTLCVIL